MDAEKLKKVEDHLRNAVGRLHVGVRCETNTVCAESEVRAALGLLLGGNVFVDGWGDVRVAK